MLLVCKSVKKIMIISRIKILIQEFMPDRIYSESTVLTAAMKVSMLVQVFILTPGEIVPNLRCSWEK